MSGIASILGNSQQLDGGAMFGNAPKALWRRWVAPDDQNRIPLSCRCLLVEDRNPTGGTRRILFEAGVGAFFDPALRTRYGVQEAEHCLVKNLVAKGVQPEDVDVVVLSHLHFDHAGGLLTAWQEGEEPSLVFPKARYIVGKEQWLRATNPHARDKASYIPQLNRLLLNSGQLELVDKAGELSLGSDYRVHFSSGHTPGMMLTEINLPDGPLLFAADLIPGVPWIHVPITMGYDRAAEQLIDEKEALLNYLHAQGGSVFFTHDHQCAVAKVSRDAKGKFHANNCVPDFYWSRHSSVPEK
ncbi:MAG: MBL fold metallo-hydrolase [Pseudomonadales bacterium]|nr:MBL fold metallo-hydrolase [Pseudomonadales bacterium]